MPDVARSATKTPTANTPTSTATPPQIHRFDIRAPFNTQTGYSGFKFSAATQRTRRDNSFKMTKYSGG